MNGKNDLASLKLTTRHNYYSELYVVDVDYHNVFNQGPMVFRMQGGNSIRQHAVYNIFIYL